MRASREASGTEISAPSNPTISSCPIAARRSDSGRSLLLPRNRRATTARLLFNRLLIDARSSPHLPLQLSQQIQGCDRRNAVQLGLAQLFEHRLRKRCEDRQLRERRGLCALIWASSLVPGEHIARAGNHLRRQSGEFGYFNAV